MIADTPWSTSAFYMAPQDISESQETDLKKMPHAGSYGFILRTLLSIFCIAPVIVIDGGLRLYDWALSAHGGSNCSNTFYT